MQLIVNTEDELGKAAGEILKKAGEKRKFGFYGQMGAGKTTLIKSICRELGVKDNVASPTFAIIYEYEGKDGNSPVYHIDAYRLKNVQEAINMGMEEYLYSDNYCFIEWPEKVEAILPEDLVKIRITVNDKNVRNIITEL